jgi:hypothetical protein
VCSIFVLKLGMSFQSSYFKSLDYLMKWKDSELYLFISIRFQSVSITIIRSEVLRDKFIFIQHSAVNVTMYYGCLLLNLAYSFVKDVLGISVHLSVHPSSCCSHLEQRAFVKCSISRQFHNFRQLVGLLGQGISPSQGHYLHRTTQTENKCRQASMPWVGCKPMIPAFEWADVLCPGLHGHCDWR